MAKIFNDTSQLFQFQGENQFLEIAIEIFHHQYNHTPIYHNYVNHLKIAPESVKKLEKIPFLPIQFFKSHEVIGSYAHSERIFRSSGTTSLTASKHLVSDLHLYEMSFRKGFEYFYGNPDQYCFLALLPSYLEREDSSLVYMMEHLIASTRQMGSGFFLHDFESLSHKIRSNEIAGIPTVLLGVTFALLDFAREYPCDLKSTVIMETGGMKGRREEMTRAQVHAILQKAFGSEAIHSEYGMTELLSQAYSKGSGLFQCPPWMKVLSRQTSDPLSLSTIGRGGINVMDLANVHSCSFIATDDLGIVFPDGSFEITGRYDHSEARGCNLMVI